MPSSGDPVQDAGCTNLNIIRITLILLYSLGNHLLSNEIALLTLKIDQGLVYPKHFIH